MVKIQAKVYNDFFMSEADGTIRGTNRYCNPHESWLFSWSIYSCFPCLISYFEACRWRVLADAFKFSVLNFLFSTIKLANICHSFSWKRYSVLVFNNNTRRLAYANEKKGWVSHSIISMISLLNMRGRQKRFLPFFHL